MHSIFECLNLGIMELKTDLTIGYWNRWMEAKTGISREEAVGRKLDEILDGVNPVLLKKRIRTSLEMDGTVYYNAATPGWLFRLPRPRVSRSHYEDMQQYVTIVPNELKEGHVVLTVVDQTTLIETQQGLKEKQAQLSDLNKNLSRLVEEQVGKIREQEIIMMQQSRLAAMGEMIGAIAHQWRQPLNAISVFIDSIELYSEMGDLTPEVIADISRRSREQIEYMAATIEDFRNFFRSDREPEYFSLKWAVAKVLSLMNPQLSRGHIKVESRCEQGKECAIWQNHLANDNPAVMECPSQFDCEYFVVSGFKNEFIQALVNIMNNAKDAIAARRLSEGKGYVGHIRFSFIVEEGKAVVRICDNGGGIPESAFEKIFEPYFTTKPKAEGGTGIGLYLTRAIIEQNMSGSISAENIDDGACFTIRIPVARQGLTVR